MLDREAGSAPPSPNPAATALEVATATPSLSEAAAHAAASAAAAAQTDNVSSANAYSATLRMLGYNMCATAMNASALITPNFPGAANQPPSSTRVLAIVDSMATYFVVNKREHLVRVTNSNPGFTVLTAAGVQPILAVGDAHVWLPDSAGVWKCYEVPNVLLMPACSSILYSVRVTRDLFGSSTTLIRARVRLPCQIVGSLWPSTTTALPSSCPLLSARPPSRLYPWSSRLVADQQHSWLALVRSFQRG